MATRKHTRLALAAAQAGKTDITCAKSRALATPNREPSWLEVAGEPGVYLGFRKMPPPAGSTAAPVETWVVRFPSKAAASGRKEKTLGAHDDHHSAMRALRAVLDDVRAERTVNDWTVADLCKAYTDAMERGDKLQRRVKAGVRATQEERTTAATALRRRHARFILGGKHSRGEYPTNPIARIKLADLTERHVAAWHASFVAAMPEANERTINREVQCLRAPLNYGRDMLDLAALKSDKAWKETLHKIDVDEEDFARDLMLSKADRMLLISKAPAELVPFLMLLMMLPLRPGAAAQLTTDHFDVETRTLHVEFDKKHAGRKFIVSVATAAFIESLMKGKVHAPLLTREGGDAWTSATWREAFNKARAAAFPEGDKRAEACMYTMRHSTITDLINANVPATKVAYWAGTSVKEIEKTYMQHGVDENGLTGMEALDLKVAA